MHQDNQSISKNFKNYKVELRLIYNIGGKGIVKEVNKSNLNCVVSHLQYYDGCLNKYLSNTDIGIVPQLKILKKRKIKNIGYFLSKQLFKRQYSLT